MNIWPYWMFEENIKLVNEISEEEDKKTQEDSSQNSMPDASSIMKSAQNITSNLNIPKF